jgi:hypothetical protein
MANAALVRAVAFSQVVAVRVRCNIDQPRFRARIIYAAASPADLIRRQSDVRNAVTSDETKRRYTCAIGLIHNRAVAAHPSVSASHVEKPDLL